MSSLVLWPEDTQTRKRPCDKLKVRRMALFVVRSSFFHIIFLSSEDLAGSLFKGTQRSFSKCLNCC